MSTDNVLELNKLAKQFKALHSPGNPVILANVHDALSAQLVASDPSCKAVASASWAVAASQGVEDDDMTFEQNLQGIRNISAGLANAGKSASIPLSLDLQDGYQDIQHTIKTVIALGCVGANIEDVDLEHRKLRTIEDATNRVQLAVQAAIEAGVPDFVVNARTDALGYGGDMDDVLERSAAYLKAGATTAFVWGVRVHEISIEDVTHLCKKLDGRLAVHGPGPTKLGVDELRKAGVSRISIGPWFYRQAMQQFSAGAITLMKS